MKKLFLVASVADAGSRGQAVEVQWSANDGVIVPATSSKNPAPAVNVDVASTLGHNAIPTDPGVLAETATFFTR